MSIKSISSAFHLSRNTVRKYVRRYQESGLTLDQLMTMSEEKLQELFLDNQNRSRKPSPRMDELEALIPDYVKRLSRKGVTVKSLHDEYLREHPDGYKYSTFKRAVRRQKYHVRVVGHVDHLAGDQMYIDYAGDKLEIVDAETGEVCFVEVFVAILPCSHYTYCEAVWSQKKEDLIVACENALHFFGGAPMAIVPDNLKAAVTRSDRRMSGRKESRRELFEEVEKEYLQPLPAVRFQMKARKTVTVMKNSYVMLNKHHYSVPKEYIGKRVDIVYDADSLQIYHGLKLVTSHMRNDTPYGYTQKEAHRLPGRHGSYEKDLGEIYERAGAIDNILLNYLREVAAQKKYLPLAFRMNPMCSALSRT